MTFAIGVVAEVIALLVVGPTVDRLGRHNIVALGQLLGGGACLACAMVTGGFTQAVLAGIGKFGCSGEPHPAESAGAFRSWGWRIEPCQVNAVVELQW
jgi:MFS family permease